MRKADGKYKLKRYSAYIHISPSNKFYIGITCQAVDARWGEFGVGYRTQVLFWRAIQKYGWDNFQHIVLFTDLSLEQAVRIEKILIELFKSNQLSYGYNLTDGGEGISGYTLTDEQREHRRLASTGRKHTQNTKDKLSKLKLGSKLNLTDEQRSKCAERMRENGKANIGRKKTAEERAKISASLQKYYQNGGKPHHCKSHSEETKRKIGNAARGRVISEATKEKLRQAAIKQWERQKAERNI